ncbi:MAG: hypothetical protein KKD39_03625 [Candidatus Altiarchaeota archaeon]|nr:hypothetical protein [Candidatus Altiarchaeota archaeon]
MKHDIVVVGEEDEVVGYRLAGVSKAYTPSTENLKDKLMDGKNIIFITRKAKAALKEDIDEVYRKAIVQEIPEWNKPYGMVAEIIKDTVGFDLRK